MTPMTTPDRRNAKGIDSKPAPRMVLVRLTTLPAKLADPPLGAPSVGGAPLSLMDPSNGRPSDI